MSRWSLISFPGEPATDVYVDDPETGRTLVGTLYLNDSDKAELAEMITR